VHKEVDSKFLDKIPSERRPLKRPCYLLGSPHGLAELGHSLEFIASGSSRLGE
jgi:hypothetical protein